MGKSVVGVEITEESVRAVEVSTGKSPHVMAFGEVALPPDAAKDSEVLDPGAVSVAIRQLWSGAKISGKTVHLGLASRRVLVREYTTTAMRPDLLRQALPFQVQDLLPVPVSQAVLDYLPTSQDGDQLHGLLVAAVSETVETMIATFSRAKLRVADVDLTAFGLARVATRIAPRGVVAMVSIGDHTTQVVITRDGVPQFVRLIPIDLPTSAVRRKSAAGNPLTDDELLLDLEPEPALAVAEVALPGRSIRRGAERGRRPVADLVARIRSTLAFFANRPDALPLDQVIVTGAGAAVDGVGEALVSGMDVPVRIAAIDGVMSVRGAHPAGELGLNLVATLGIALGKDR
jgi:type IV pilus assembly protein PilM